VPETKRTALKCPKILKLKLKINQNLNYDTYDLTKKRSL
jgi:hypothetical protein